MFDVLGARLTNNSKSNFDFWGARLFFGVQVNELINVVHIIY